MMSRQSEIDRINKMLFAVPFSFHIDQEDNCKEIMKFRKLSAEVLVDNGIGTKSRFETELPANFDKEYEEEHANDVCNVLNLTRIRPIDYTI